MIKKTRRVYCSLQIVSTTYVYMCSFLFLSSFCLRRATLIVLALACKWHYVTPNMVCHLNGIIMRRNFTPIQPRKYDDEAGEHMKGISMCKKKKIANANNRFYSHAHIHYHLIDKSDSALFIYCVMWVGIIHGCHSTAAWFIFGSKPLNAHTHIGISHWREFSLISFSPLIQPLLKSVA